jgi:hypothetical protein
MPVMPAIFFGILSKKVTFKGAIASVLVGAVMAAIFVSDQWLGVEAGTRWFPWIHNSLTNYSFRGLRGTLIIIATCLSFPLYREDGSREIGENHDSLGYKDGTLYRTFGLALTPGHPIRRNGRTLCLALVMSATATERVLRCRLEGAQERRLLILQIRTVGGLPSHLIQMRDKLASPALGVVVGCGNKAAIIWCCSPQLHSSKPSY